MEKWEKIADDYFKLGNKLNIECINYLTKKLKNKKDNKIDFTNQEYSCTVVYDGGRHPEYASNVFSTVDSIYLKDNILFIDTEDFTSPIDCCSTVELYNICCFIDDFKL